MKAVEVIKKIAEDEVKKLNMVEMGIVTSIFPHSDANDHNNYECNVKFKNRNLELRKVPIATWHIGLTSVPSVGDLVLIAFIQGNINAPVVIGRLYNDEDIPPVHEAGEIVFESPDAKKSEVRRLFMKFPNGIVLTITDDELKAEVGKSVVTIQTDGDVTIESNAKFDIKAKGNTTVASDGDLSLSARNIRIESKQGLDLKAGTTASVEATATLDIKGALININ
jgi:uncharacterized protein involved in type VI secretion and phage assembly